MINEDLEQSMLNDSIKKVEDFTGLRIKPRYINNQNDSRYEAEIEIILEGYDLRFYVIIKKFVSIAAINVIIDLFSYNRENEILVTRYISPATAEILRKKQLNYIDTAGNAHIKAPPLYLFVEGKKLDVEYSANKPRRIFYPAGLKVIFALLCNPGLEQDPYRKIGKYANAANGTVGWIINDLIQMKYMVEYQKGKRRFLNSEKLFEQWVEMYPKQLRIKYIIGRYETDVHNWWNGVDLTEFGAKWGGEIAASKITKSLKPEIKTIYTKDNINHLLLKYKMRKNPKGDIEILKQFWAFEESDSLNDIVPLPLIYADLIATGDARNMEVAKEIYDKTAIKYFK